MSAASRTDTATPGLLGSTPVDYPVASHVLTVGQGKEFGTVSAAVGAARDGDVVLVDAGTYKNDFATISARVTLIGVGGMVDMVATVPPDNLKGILTVNNDATVENFSFSGAAISAGDGGNGAGIRYQGGHLTLVDDKFSGNQDGMLATPTLPGLTNVIGIDHCLFSGNGSGSGFTHNLYVNGVSNLTVTNSVFEKAVVGHEFKSRAEATTVENCVFRDGPDGTASYDIDLPNAGAAVIRNNVIEKGPQSQNYAMVHYGGENVIPYAGSSLLVEGNTFVNDQGPNAIGVLNATGFGTTVRNNTFGAIDAGKLVNGPATLSGNVDGTGKPYADSTLTGVLPGSTAVFADKLDHAVTLTGGLLAVQGGAGHLTVQAANGHVVAIGGSGGMDYSESSGGNQVTTAAGSANSLVLHGQDVVDSRGNDRIRGGVGNLTGQVGGTAAIDDGTGDDTWTVNGTAALTGHGASLSLGVGAQGKAGVTGSLSALKLQNNGGTVDIDAVIGGARRSASFVGGAFDVQTYGNQLDVTTASGTHGTALRLGAGDAQVLSAGNDVIWGGSGTNSIIISGQAKFHAGTGATFVYGRGSAGADVYANGGRMVLGGDTGNLTYHGGDGDNAVQDNLGNNRLVGGAGRMAVTGGSRNTIVGGAGGLTYDSQGGGANAIQTAAGSTNSLLLSAGSTVDSWGRDTISGGAGNQVMTVHGDAAITGSTGDSQLTLMGKDVLDGRGYDQVSVTRGADVTVSAGWRTSVRASDAKVTYSASGTGAGHAVVEGGGASVDGGSSRPLAVTTDAGTSTKVTLGAGSATVASQGADRIYTAGANATLSLQAGAADVTFGSGAATVASAGSGQGNTFHFVAGQGGGTDVIDGFRVGKDRLELDGVGIGSQSAYGGSTRFVLTDGTHVDLAGVAITSDSLFGGSPAPAGLAKPFIGPLVAPDGFDAAEYLQANPDVAAAGVDPAWHFHNYGWHEGRNPDALFDVRHYLAHNPDVAAAGVDPLRHYDQYGWREGRDPSAQFSTGAYLAAYKDVAAAGIDPLVHYLQYGAAEGRSAFAA